MSLARIEAPSLHLRPVARDRFEIASLIAADIKLYFSPTHGEQLAYRKTDLIVQVVLCILDRGERTIGARRGQNAEIREDPKQDASREAGQAG